MTRFDNEGRNISLAVRLSASSEATREVGCTNGNFMGETGRFANFDTLLV